MADLDDLLRRQWHRVRTWVEEADLVGRREEPSGLEGWTVGDLVAHLGYGITMIADISPAPDETEPMSLREYVAFYPPASDVIAEQTRERAMATAEDLLGGVDAAADREIGRASCRERGERWGVGVIL